MTNHRFHRRDLLKLAGLGLIAPLAGCLGSKSRPKVRPTMPQQIGSCVIDPDRLASLTDCMECCGPDSPTDDWDHSCIHPHSVAYSCGRLARPGGPNTHDHDPEELARCRRLAQQAAAILGDMEVNLSESSSTLDAFFVTANRGDAVPPRVTGDVIRKAFGETIYPAAKIVADPLTDRGYAWEQIAVSADRPNDPPVERESNRQRLARWQEIVKWFESQKDLHGGAFVLVGDEPLSKTNFGCVFPRLVVALSTAGSLVGVCGHAVHT